MIGQCDPEPWLSILGIGEDGLDGLGKAARALLAGAEFVVGGARHLALAGPLAARTMAWPHPLEDGIRDILAARGRRVCVLATGDPFWFGIGALLARHVPAGEMRCIPAPSSASLAAARLGWSLHETVCLSVHGRPLEVVVPHLHDGARLVALSWDGTTPGRLAALLAARGFGGSRLHVMEALGGPRERVRTMFARDFDRVDVADLNLVGIEVHAGEGARVVPLTCGLPDDAFEHDGQITKRVVRAVTLAALAPRRGETLWDVGAGSGSVAIEWLLADPSLSAIAFECDGGRAARIARNASALGVPRLSVVEGRAPACLPEGPPPQAIFVGGGGGDPALLDTCWAALPSGGRLVVNAITIETEAELARRHAAHGGEMVRIAVSHAEALGPWRGWRPAMAVTQWAAVKP